MEEAVLEMGGKSRKHLTMPRRKRVRRSAIASRCCCWRVEESRTFF